MLIENERSFSLEGKFGRVVPRTRVLMKAVLVTAEGRTIVRVRDLSLTGARVLLEAPPLADTDILFCKGKTIVAARVAWVCSRTAGLTFHRELSRREAQDIFGAHQVSKWASPTERGPSEAGSIDEQG